MRLKSISIQNHPPIERFEVEDLSDLVVIAGPNGMGKSRLLEVINLMVHDRVNYPVRLVVEATSEAEKVLWGQPSFELTDPSSREAFLLAGAHRYPRGRIQSTFLRFESTRSRGFDNISIYPFSWKVSDPVAEHGAPTREPLRTRLIDVIHTLFRMIYFYRSQLADRAEHLADRGHDAMTLDRHDPLERFRKVFAQLFDAKEMLKPDIENQKLNFKFQGQTFPLEALSSGEKEVLAIVFDFVLRNPEDCIILFDEPELHLHPELTLRMVEVLRGLPGRNQFIFCTHSAPLISLGLQHQLIFLRPPKSGQNQALVVKPEDTAPLQLLGQELGVFSLGKKMVLIEGSKTSLDHQTYRAIIHDTHPELVLIPAGGRKIIENFHLFQEQVLGRSVWGTEFFMLCDRDAVSSEEAQRWERKHPGRLKFLARYHLENYFLDENILAQVCDKLKGNKDLRSPEAIQQKLLELGREELSYALSLYLTAELRNEVGRIEIKVIQGKDTPAAIEALVAKGQSELERVTQKLKAEAMRARATHWHTTLQKSIEQGQEWKKLIPGKRILKRFAGEARVSELALKEIYLDCAKTARNDPFAEIREIFASFDRGAPAAPAD